MSEFLEEEEEVEPPWWRRILIIGVAIVFVILIVSLSFIQPAINFVASSPIQQNVLFFGDTGVQFTGDVLSTLRQHYVQNQEREIKACLFGEEGGKFYKVTNITFPKVLESSVGHVKAEFCPSSTLIDLHSHPTNNCLASNQDLRYFSLIKQNKNSIRMIVMCSLDRFALV